MLYTVEKRIYFAVDKRWTFRKIRRHLTRGAGDLTSKQLKDISLPKIRERLSPDFTSFVGSVTSRVQEPNFFAVGE